MNTSSTTRTAQNYTVNGQSGVSLIEVLIALLVLTIGLVGMAALHLSSLANTHSAYYRSIAATIALDLEERLWLEAAHLDPGECPDITSARDDLVAHWQSGTSSLLGSPLVYIPNVALTLGTLNDEPDGPGPWREVPLTVTWAEERFEQGELESFEYSMRVICKPDDE